MKIIQTLSNTQKKILAGVLAITFPVWVLVIVPLFIVFMIFAIIYAGIADALDVK